MISAIRRVSCWAPLVGCVFVALLAAPSRAGFTIFSVGGDATTASIQATFDAFRAALGNPNNGNNAGPLIGGRREINWDGGGVATATPVGTPMATFQNRGVTLTTPGTGFLQTPLNVAELTSINPTYTTTFNTFSAQRIFTPLDSNLTDAVFSLPGSGGATPATVSGFGAVFTDVDLANTTTIELFGIGDAVLTTLNVPPDTVVDGGLSFIGAIANAGERIARVRITTGNGPLGPNDTNGNPADVVVMDDFLYSEPTAVPEPASATLTIAGLASWAVLLRRRRH
jgi:uncharacterized protein (TIGR03382 family)